MAEAKLLKSVRVVEPVQGINFDGTFQPSDRVKRVKNSTDGVRMDVYQKGKRKYAVLSRFGLENTTDNAGAPTDYYPDEKTGHKFDKLDQSLSDDEVIKYALNEVREKWYNALGGIDTSKMIMQDPWKDDPPERRRYGFTFYYLNDGSQVHIKWLKNTFVEGSDYDDADDKGVTDKTVTIFPYTKDHGTDKLPPEFKDQADASTRGIVKRQRENGTIDWGDKIEFSEEKKWGYTQDSVIIQMVIDQMKRQIREVTGDWQTAEKLALCDPDTEFCKLIKHIDYNTPPPPKTTEEVAKEEIQQITASQSTTGTIKLVIDGLPEKIEIKAKENLPTFKIWAGEIPEQINDAQEITDIEELDEEYQESAIAIPALEEAEVESASWTPERAAEDAKVLEEIEKKGPDGGGDEIVVSNETIVKGKWELTPLSKTFVTNSGKKIQCVAIDGSPVNINVAAAYLDMQAAAKKDGISIDISSAFRSPYDSISETASSGYQNGKKVSNVSISASSQKYLYDGWLAKKKGFNLAAKPGESNHGNGIAFDLNTGGSSKSRYSGVNEKNLEWLVKNSWKFGFVRTVANEEWHYDYRPDIAAKGPYAALSAKDTGSVKTKFYNKRANGTYWGLDEIKIA